MKYVRRTIAGAAALLLVFLAIGFLLPARWTVERSVDVPAAPADVFPYLNTVALWEAWTPWGEIEASPVGPAAGVGAGREWDDRQYGRGSFFLTDSEPPRSISYRVRIEDGSATIRGRIRLVPMEGGTRIVWTEEGDFGRNPVLGWTALFVGEDQGRVLEESLRRLRDVVRAGPESGATDADAERST